MNRPRILHALGFGLGVALGSAACADAEPTNNGQSGGASSKGQGGASGDTTGGTASGGAPTAGATSSGGGGTGGAATTSGGRGGASNTGGVTSATGGQPVGGPSLPYSEDFEGPIEMPEWYINIGEDGVASGDWKTVADGAGKALQESSKTEESWTVGGSYVWKDQRLEVKVKIALTNPDDVADVRFRIAIRYSPAQAYFADFQGNGSVQLGKIASSGGGDIGSEGKAPAFVGGTWVTVAVQAKGSTITAFVNGTQYAQATDATITAGGIALGSSEEVAILYDDVSVTTPP